TRSRQPQSCPISIFETFATALLKNRRARAFRQSGFNWRALKCNAEHVRAREKELPRQRDLIAMACRRLGAADPIPPPPPAPGICRLANDGRLRSQVRRRGRFFLPAGTSPSTRAQTAR